MIKYSLICDEEHEFDGWFPSSEDYDKQLKKGLLLCPLCDSKEVRKSIMAPNIKKPKTKKPTHKEHDITDCQQEHMVMGSKARHLLRKLERHVKENFEDVGDTFAKEARKADRGERNHDFYGSATDKEVNDLVDDGIDVFHVPSIKDN